VGACVCGVFLCVSLEVQVYVHAWPPPCEREKERVKEKWSVCTCGCVCVVCLCGYYEVQVYVHAWPLPCVCVRV